VEVSISMLFRLHPDWNWMEFSKSFSLSQISGNLRFQELVTFSRKLTVNSEWWSTFSDPIGHLFI
jgi:hypothetical protein